MYRHILIPTDGSELAEQAVTNGLALAKSVGAKVTVIIVEEPIWLGAPSLAEYGALEELGKYTEQIKNYHASVLKRAADAAKQAGVPCGTIQMKDANPIKPSLQRPRIEVAISSSWHRTGAADYPQSCSAA